MKRYALSLSLILTSSVAHAQVADPIPALPAPVPAPAPAPVSPIPVAPTPAPAPAPAAFAVAPAPAETLAAAAPTPPEEPPRPRSGFFFAQAGGAMRNVAGTTIYGGDFRVGGGGGRNVPIYGFGGLTWGATTSHLRAYTINAGMGFEGRLEPLPLRLGVGGEFQYLVIRRASVDGNFNTLGIGVFAQGTIDIIRFDEAGSSALTVSAKINATLLNGTFMWGPSVLAGVRF